MWVRYKEGSLILIQTSLTEEQPHIASLAIFTYLQPFLASPAWLDRSHTEEPAPMWSQSGSASQLSHQMWQQRAWASTANSNSWENAMIYPTGTFALGWVPLSIRPSLVIEHRYIEHEYIEHGYFFMDSLLYKLFKHAESIASST